MFLYLSEDHQACGDHSTIISKDFASKPHVK